MSNNRYKATYREWVSTHNIDYSDQRRLIDQEETFKTKNEATEFFETFKDDKTVIGLKVVDSVSNKVILENNTMSSSIDKHLYSRTYILGK